MEEEGSRKQPNRHPHARTCRSEDWPNQDFVLLFTCFTPSNQAESPRGGRLSS